jgi:hypothetical protein
MTLPSPFRKPARWSPWLGALARSAVLLALAPPKTRTP